MLCACLGMTLGPPSAALATGQPPTTGKSTGPAGMPPAWMTEAWSGDDAPYRRSAIEVEQEIRHSRTPGVVETQLKARALKTPGDALAVFRWATATFLVAGAVPGFAEGPDEPAAEHLLTLLPPPHAATFTEVHLLLDVHNDPDPVSSRQAYQKQLAERLLRHFPADLMVKYTLLQLLDIGDTPVDTAQALSIARGLVVQAPSDYAAHSVLGNVYFQMYISTYTPDAPSRSTLATRRTYARLALREFWKYLRLAPPDAVNRSQVAAAARVVMLDTGDPVSKGRH